MVPISDLWLSIIIASVLVFFSSSFLHMVLPWHRKDFGRIPKEDAVLDALRQAGIGRGDYMFPCPSKPGDMRSPEMCEKYKRGPSGILTIMPPGMPRMGRYLGLWFAYCLAVGIFVAYLTGLALPPGAEYRVIFRLASTIAFLTYAGALWQNVIWLGRSWKMTLRSTIDGFIYALLTAGAFAGFWPGS